MVFYVWLVGNVWSWFGSTVQDLPPKSPVQVRIKESDWLQPAGIISSIVEDMLVIQAHKTSKPLDVG